MGPLAGGIGEVKKREGWAYGENREAEEVRNGGAA